MRFVISFLALVLTAFAADITGTWKGEYEANGEKHTAIITLKQNEDKLTGSVNDAEGNAEIRDGKINVTEFTFVVARKVQGREVKTNYRGVVAGKDMRLKATTVGTGRSMDIWAERQ